MSLWSATFWSAFLVPAPPPAGGEAPTDAAAGTAIHCKKVITVSEDDQVFHDGLILIKDGRIEAVGRAKDVAIPAGYEVVEAPDLWAVPGFIDCHDHVAGSLSDLNDGVYLSNPGLRTLDVVSPENRDVRNAIAGGITTVLLIPGSGNNMSGFGTIVKTAGHTPEEVVVRYPGSIKVAQSGNPERYWYGVARSFMNWNTRQTFLRARDYHQRWTEYEQHGGEPPAYDPTWHEFRGLFRHEFPASVHTQIYQVVAETIMMLHDDLGVKAFPDHSEFDAHLLGGEAADRDMVVVCGPRVLHFERRDRRIYGLAAGWYESSGRRVRLGVNTDAPVIPQHEQPLQCAMGVYFGLPYELRLPALTRVPAQALLVWDRVGSLEPGKDADVALWTGDPVDPASACLKVWVNGRLGYDADRDGRRF